MRRPKILSLMLALFLTSPILATESTSVDGVTHIKNRDQPAGGARTIQLEEIWRAGADDEEVLFGVITDALSDDTGKVYLLDMQLNQIHVFSPDGQFLQIISGEGDGPGEIREPSDMFLLADGTLGIVHRAPGVVTRIDLEGVPRSAVRYSRSDGEAAGFVQLRHGQYRAGTFVLCGQEFKQEAERKTRHKFLSIFGNDGTEKIRLLDHDGEAFNFKRRSYVEIDDHFVDQAGLWTLGPEGNIYAAQERNRYAVHVYRPDGSLVRVISRDYRPWRRTDDEKRKLADKRTMMFNGKKVKLDTTFEDHEPCVKSLRVDAMGRLWVQHGRTTEEPPAGILLSYDLFDAGGSFMEIVHVACAGDRKQDRLLPLDDGRYILLRGITGAIDAMYGMYNPVVDDAEVTPLEVICLKAAW